MNHSIIHNFCFHFLSKSVYVVTATNTTVLPDCVQSGPHESTVNFLLIHVTDDTNIINLYLSYWIYKYLCLEIVIFYTFNHHPKALYKLLFC